jgi:hypothetical protein
MHASISSYTIPSSSDISANAINIKYRIIITLNGIISSLMLLQKRVMLVSMFFCLTASAVGETKFNAELCYYKGFIALTSTEECHCSLTSRSSVILEYS